MEEIIEKMEKKKPYRVIIRCGNHKTIKRAVTKLIEEFEGDSEIRIGKIHRG